MRFGLVGTGYWAAEVHAPALTAADDVEFVGVWGRDTAKAARVADAYGTTAYEDADALFAEVDAVAFAVPPDVQADLAVRAARAGCHLLLEKPVALTATAAHAVRDAAEAAGVASVVFLTSRFVPPIQRWLEETAAEGGWLGGQATLLAALDAPGNPFGASPWRREHGALWDVGPHVLSLLLPVLGPVHEVRAAAGPGDTVHLALRHEGGASSQALLSLTMPEAAAGRRLAFYGPAGWRELPGGLAYEATDALGVAVAALSRAADGGSPHPCDVRFGADIVDVLAAAQDDLARTATGTAGAGASR
ncbi:Gfo/Idh/MocA family protein [Egicoccus sp. AB-alg2]|uniref:Gfo/Idh/MocA family protein n=1 Tax=Egicoccus sp. AB-alg2 TaxID=3242693 RepID=UPI00359EDE2B